MSTCNTSLSPPVIYCWPFQCDAFVVLQDGDGFVLSAHDIFVGLFEVSVMVTLLGNVQMLFCVVFWCFWFFPI